MSSKSSYKIIIFTTSFIVGLIAQPACNKLIEIPPPTTAIADNGVFTNDETAVSVLTGLYTDMSSNGIFAGRSDISILAGLSADELEILSGSSSELHNNYYHNSLVTGPMGLGVDVSDLWRSLYNYIFKCNAAIEGLNASQTLTAYVRKQLLGEAKFLRAFYYFYLANLYGDVPLTLSTDYKSNALLSRSPKKKVFDQILIDLQDAILLLSRDYVDGNLKKYSADPERVRPTSWAAESLLARVQLYAGNYMQAETAATNVIDHRDLFELTTLADVFLKNSKEAIWQLQSISALYNTEDGFFLDLPDTGPDMNFQFIYLSNTLASSFEPNDQRRVIGNWIDSVTVDGVTYYYPFKYKNNTSGPPYAEYFNVFRLAEQYLIRAEARAYLGNITGAQDDLNVVRGRAGLPGTTADNQTSILDAILHERRVELFSEWGHRWLDLKRTGLVDTIMSMVTPLKTDGDQWESFQQLYPIPYSDIESGPNLKQNPGY